MKSSLDSQAKEITRITRDAIRIVGEFGPNDLPFIVSEVRALKRTPPANRSIIVFDKGPECDSLAVFDEDAILFLDFGFGPMLQTQQRPKFAMSIFPRMKFEEIEQRLADHNIPVVIIRGE